MSARNDLFDLYRRWRLLSQAEGEAIRVAAWVKVEQCQAGKHELQAQIVTASAAAEEEMSLWGVTPGEWERQLRATVTELIALEARNGEWLAAQRQQAQAQQQELERTRRSLRQVQGAYARRPGRRGIWSECHFYCLCRLA